MANPTLERPTAERLAEIRRRVEASADHASLTRRELLAELDAVIVERDQWEAKYTATVEAWEQAKVSRAASDTLLREVLDTLRNPRVSDDVVERAARSLGEHAAETPWESFLPETRAYYVGMARAVLLAAIRESGDA